MVSHAGAALLRELADRLGLTRVLGWQQGGSRRVIAAPARRPARGGPWTEVFAGGHGGALTPTGTGSWFAGRDGG